MTRINLRDAVVVAGRDHVLGRVGDLIPPDDHAEEARLFAWFAERHVRDEFARRARALLPMTFDGGAIERAHAALRDVLADAGLDMTVTLPTERVRSVQISLVIRMD